ncbi:MAG: inorganic pyrophosphatase [Chitinophagales bacterium]|nr:inorganic pyrophosphatase [Chitinophagales bacterium]
MKKSEYKKHPWHGISPGAHCPDVINAFIEIVPTDTVKYEIDKESGWLKVDRPQLFSVTVPALYGFIPQTYCSDAVATLSMQRTGLSNIRGDGDPLDVLVLTEKQITTGGILIRAIPIGGLLMLDKNEADDKIIAVMQDDAVYGHLTDISQLSDRQIDKLRHYFLTYKSIPGRDNPVTIAHVYGRLDARDVILRSIDDYHHQFA